jgi:hypothetical protein
MKNEQVLRTAERSIRDRAFEIGILCRMFTKQKNYVSDFVVGCLPSPDGQTVSVVSREHAIAVLRKFGHHDLAECLQNLNPLEPKDTPIAARVLVSDDHYHYAIVSVFFCDPSKLSKEYRDHILPELSAERIDFVVDRQPS